MESIICTLFPIASRLQWRLCWRRQLSGWDFTKGSNWNKSSKIIAWVLSFCSLRFIVLQLGFYNFITSAMCSFFNTHLTWWNKYEKICLCIYQLFAFIIWVFFFQNQERIFVCNRNQNKSLLRYFLVVSKYMYVKWTSQK